MASTKRQEARSKKYYHSNESYRKKKIKKTADEHKADKPKYNKLAREYYRKNKKYREYKKAYSRNYKRTHKKSS